MSLFLSLFIRCEPVSGGVLWHIAESNLSTHMELILKFEH